MPDGARIFLVLPTYNERENLPFLITAVQALPDPINILVVDDNSPDGTGQLADNLAAANPAVQVIHRSGKLGLGTAYTAGFEYALAQGADLILTMDADFSHDPKYLPGMLDASRRFDLVIGSRYIPNGGVRDWGPERRALSRGANAIAHYILGLKARDCTAGFRCYPRAVLGIPPAWYKSPEYRARVVSEPRAPETRRRLIVVGWFNFSLTVMVPVLGALVLLPTASKRRWTGTHGR